ncbi:GNAT family N-acetyltransferase [Paenibacillus lemnae]|uniref:GNAT family N-acetyltransferase n=1 Tax=Paenibacillus lemnae TaxID=1330551 RepID=A0A848MCA0_PAELE|nr:GNAT family N-acetyltransferase [Paenibacillus lemnae]NMO97683.1 GNAT family N-acetyltransferase [Paenibacillus lemnae]
MKNYIHAIQATRDDLNHVAELFNQYRLFYGQESTPADVLPFIQERMVNRDSVIFIAKESSSNRCVGFTQLYPSFSSISMQRTWILNDLYVEEDFRGAGVGRLLIDKAKEHAEQTQSKGLNLATAADNLRAQSLYEHYGFIKDEHFFHYSLNV